MHWAAEDQEAQLPAWSLFRVPRASVDGIGFNGPAAARLLCGSSIFPPSPLCLRAGSFVAGRAVRSHVCAWV